MGLSTDLGLTNLGLAGPRAQRSHGTPRTERFPSEAAAASVRLDEMRREGELAPWQHLHELIVLLDARLGHRDDRAGLCAIETRGAHLLLHGLRFGPRVVARRWVLREESRRDLVHPLVRALSREDRGDQQLEWIPEVERDLGVGIGFLQRVNDRLGPGSLGVPRLPHEYSPYGLAEIRMASGVTSIRPSVTGIGKRLGIRGVGSQVRT